MTVENEASRSVEPDLSSVIAGVGIANKIRKKLADPVEVVLIDRMDLQGTAKLTDLPVSELLSLGSSGHVVTFEIAKGGWSVIVRSDSHATPTIDSEGDYLSVMTKEIAEEYQRAVANGDPQRLCKALQQFEVKVLISVRNDPATTKSHWIHTRAQLETLLHRDQWHETAQNLGRASVLSIDDLDTSAIPLSGLVVRDTSMVGRVPSPEGDTNDFRSRRALDGRPQLPSPLKFSLRSSGPHADEVKNLVDLFAGLSAMLTWYWLASKIEIDESGRMVAIFSGARIVAVNLSLAPVDDATAQGLLYDWASNGSDPGKQEAVQHATSLAITSEADLRTAATPALRTARALYQLSRRNDVGEALSASESARTSTVQATRDAGSAGRAAASRTVERASIQIIAALGLLFTHSASIVSTQAATALLVVLGIVCGGSFLVAWFVELASAKRAFAAELDALDEYRNILSMVDIDAIRSLDVVRQAKQDLSVARRVVAIGYAIAIAITVILICVVAQESIGDTYPAVSPSPSVST